MPFRRLLCYLFLIVTFATLLSGCMNKPAQDTKTPPPTGMIDMDKAIKAHPRWSQLQELNQKLNTLYAQQQQKLAAQTQATMPQAAEDGLPPAADGQNGIDDFLSQEYEAKMAAKQTELKVILDEQTATVRQSIANEYQAYASELEKEYQPQIFSLQLKAKTIQMNKEEMAALQQEIDKIQAAKETKLKTKEQELSARLETAIAPQKTELEQQLSLYAHNLQAELEAKRAQKIAAQQAPASPAVKEGQISPLSQQSVSTDNGEEITVLKQQITVLEDLIVGDIKDKVAKIAAQEGIGTVLANVDVNVSARDITNEVIAEFKK